MFRGTSIPWSRKSREHPKPAEQAPTKASDETSGAGAGGATVAGPMSPDRILWKFSAVRKSPGKRLISDVTQVARQVARLEHALAAALLTLVVGELLRAPRCPSVQSHDREASRIPDSQGERCLFESATAW